MPAKKKKGNMASPFGHSTQQQRSPFAKNLSKKTPKKKGS